MRRWLIRITVLLIVLVAAAFIAIQAVLMSTVPRNFIVRELDEATGLRWSIADLSIQWNGQSRLQNVTVSLPEDDTPFFTADSASASHSGLLRLLTGARLSVPSIAVADAAITWREDIRNRSTLERAIAIIHAHQASDPGHPSTRPIPIPAISITRTQFLHEHAGATTSLGLLSFDGKPDSSRYAFDGALGETNTFQGSIVLAEPFTHTLNVDLRAPVAVLGLFLPDLPPNLALRAQWQGAFTDGLAGRIAIHSLDAHRFHLTGPIDVATRITGGSSITTLTPKQVTLTDRDSGREATIASGHIEITPDIIRAQRLLLAQGDVRAEAKGLWNLASTDGSASVRWLTLPSTDSTTSPLTHQGDLDLHLDLDALRGFTASLTIASTGSFDTFSWSTRAASKLSGSDLSHIRATIDFAALNLTAQDQPLQLDGAAFKLSLDGPVLHLESLSVPNAEVAVTGTLNPDSMEWTVDLRASKIDHPWAMQLPGSLEVTASGAPDRIHVNALRFETPSFTLNASGDYLPDNAQPLDAHASITILSLPVALDTFARLFAQSLAPPFTCGVGAATLSTSLRGSLSPLSLRSSGTLDADRLSFGFAQPITTSLPFAANITESVTQMTIFPTAIANGSMWVVATIDPAGVSHAHAVAETISLDALVPNFSPAITSLGILSTSLDLRWPAADGSKFELSGPFAIRSLDTHYVYVEAGSGHIQGTHAALRISQVAVQTGSASASGTVDLDLVTHSADASIRFHDWPFEYEPAQLSASLTGTTQVALKNGWSFNAAAADLLAVIAHAGRPLGDFNLRGNIDSNAITLRDMQASLLGGTARGSGTFPFTDWHNAQGTVQLSGINLGSFNDVLPFPGRFAGLVNGAASISPSNDKRAPGPVKVDLALTMPGSTFESLSIGSMNGLLYLGGDGITLEKLTTNVADGSVEVWAKLSHRAGENHLRLAASFEQLDLNQLTHTLQPDAASVPGRISGKVAAGGSVASPHRFYGDSTVRITDSDLVNIRAFSMVYDALNLGFPDPTPVGYGEARINLEGDSLVLRRLSYFNRGTELRADLVIQDITAGMQSPIRGTAAGAARPLKDARLSLLSDFDRALTTFQSDSAVVRIGGTLKAPDLQLVPLSKLTAPLR